HQSDTKVFTMTMEILLEQHQTNSCDKVLKLENFKKDVVGIKSLLDAVGITAAQVCVNAAQLELVLIKNFNEKYTKCLLLLVRS
nr:hypothetical protein [Tanacetum cinerariifolium]